MATLLLRLAGPQQAWGTQSRFTIRDTEREPSKSGVIGLLCAALGRLREEPVDDLVRLQMGVRVDSEGKVERDYHTVGGSHRRGATYGVATSDGKGRAPVISTRYYLSDADFLVGLSGDEAVLEALDRALARPIWQIFLGRKAFVPGEPVRLPDAPPWGPGLRPEPLEAALAGYPFRRRGREDPPERLRLILDAAPNESGDVRRDVPLSFAERRFGLRSVRTAWVQPTEAL